MRCDINEDLSCAIRHLRVIIEGMKIIGSSPRATDEICFAVEDFNGNILRHLEETELRVAIGGETGAGKVALLNSLFNTNMFFAIQEKATGVPIEIRHGEKFAVSVLDHEGNAREKLNVDSLWLDESGHKLKDEHVQFVQDFVRAYTRLGEQALSWVSMVKVFMPVPDLPANLVLIDTPGFNARKEHTLIAEEVISNSHACLLVMDARNALKRKEMEKLIATREEISKIFLVLNKMDLVIGDDELDCDDADAADETVERVHSELTRQFQVEDILIYPVSSLNKEEVSSDAHRYVDYLVKLRERIFTETLRQQIRFVADSAVKEAAAVSRLTLEMCSNIISYYQGEVEVLEKAVEQYHQVRAGIKEQHPQIEAVHQELNVLKTVVAIIDEDSEVLSQWYVQTRWSKETLVAEQINKDIKEILILVKVPLDVDSKEVKTKERSLEYLPESSSANPQFDNVVKSATGTYINNKSQKNGSISKSKVAVALILVLTIGGGTLYYSGYASAFSLLHDARQNLDEGTPEKLIENRTDNEVNSMLWPNSFASLANGAFKKEELAQKAKEFVDTESGLSNDQIVLLLNNGGKQFVDVWFSGPMEGENYFTLPNKFNSPQKLEKFYDEYWTQNGILKLISVDKYIQGIYSGPVGNAEVPKVINILNKNLSGNYLTVSATLQYLDGTAPGEFTLVFQDGIWKVNYAPWFTALP